MPRPGPRRLPAGADHHAERGEDEADLVAAESVVGEIDDLAVNRN